MLKKNLLWRKRILICSSGLKVFYQTKNKSNSCVKSSSLSNVRKFTSEQSLEVKNGLSLSASEKLAHRDLLHIIKRGKHLYQNRFYETYHVAGYLCGIHCITVHNFSSIVKRWNDLYQNKFSVTFHVPNPGKLSEF